MVPASPTQRKIPFARVNHNKYMVTEKTVYIGEAHRFPTQEHEVLLTALILKP